MQQAELQNNWALVVAYRGAPKNPNGSLKNGERKKLETKFKKTTNQVRRIVMLVKRADRKGINIDLSDHRKFNEGRPSQLTAEIEATMKMVNRKNLKNKINTTRRRMQIGLRRQGIDLSLNSVHRYMDILKGSRL